MRKVRWIGPWIAAFVVASGCVEKPVEGTTSPYGGGIIDDPADGSKPTSTNIQFAGIHPEPGASVTIQVAKEKYAKGDSAAEFEDLATVTSNATPDPTADGTNWYRWKANVAIPDQFWYRGVSGGFVAHLRTMTTFAGVPALLGTPEQPYSQSVCIAYNANNNVYGPSYAPLLADGCKQPALDSMLVSEIRTRKYDDTCFAENKACCTANAPGTPQCDIGLTCAANGFCVRPASTTAPTGTAVAGGIAPSQKECTPDDIQEAGTGTPSDCGPAFTTTGYKTCKSDGKWGPASYYECDSISSTNPAASKKCYCSGTGPKCGSGPAASGKVVDGVIPCSASSPCRPGTCCGSANTLAGGLQEQMFCYNNLAGTPIASCWTPADLTPGASCGVVTSTSTPDPSSSGYGGFSSVGGSTTVTNRGGTSSGGSGGGGGRR
jgi:hypothetical protein